MMKYMKFSVLLATLLCTTAGAVVYRPGLIQAKISGNPAANNTAATYTSNLVATVSAELLDRTAGTMMANYRADNDNFAACVNPLSGLSWKWSQYTTYAYEGEIWLDAGIMYNMFEQGDDGAAIIIDGNVIITAGGTSRWQSGTGVSWTPSETGWHRFNAYSWDWNGGKGPVAGCWGLAWNTNGTSQTSGTISTNSTAWTSFTDPGDMSLLRMVSSESAHATVSNMVNIGGGYVDVTLAYTNLPALVTVFAVVDSVDQGAGYFSAWSQKVEVGTIPAGSGTIPFSIPFDVSKPYARLVLQCRDTLEVSFEDWLDVINLTNAETASGPTFTQTITPIYTNAVFEFQVTSIKSAAPAQFSILVSPNSDYSDSVFNEPVGDTVSADGDTVTYNVTGLQPNTLYYAKVTLSGNDVTTEKAMKFSTGLPVAPEFSVTYDPVVVKLDKAKFGLNVVSLGTKKADVYFDLSDTADFANCTTREIRLGVTEPFSDNVEESIPSDYATYGRVRVVNDWDFTTTSETMFFTTGPLFTAERDELFLSPMFSATLFGTGRIGTKVTKITLSIYDNADLIGSTIFKKDYAQDISVFPSTVRLMQAHGLNVGTTYYARLTVLNDAGNENFSDIISFTTPAAGDNVWANTSSDIENPASYVYTSGKPAGDKTLYFETPAEVSPIIDRDTTMPSLVFGIKNCGINNTLTNYNHGFVSCGYNISGSGTLSLKNQYPIDNLAFGTNTITSPICFARGSDQTQTIRAQGGDLFLDGTFSMPDGVSSVTIETQEYHYGTVSFRGDTSSFRGKYKFSSTGAVAFDSQNALVNLTEFIIGYNWAAGPADYGQGTKPWLGTTIANKQMLFCNSTGTPLVFATTNIIQESNNEAIRFFGSPFVFSNATFTTSQRNGIPSFDADMTVSNIYNKTDSILTKSGSGILTVLDTCCATAPATKPNKVYISGGCYNPLTDNGWGDNQTFYVANDSFSTLALHSDFKPMVDGTGKKILFTGNNCSFGYTAFGGDRYVCYNNDSTFNIGLYLPPKYESEALSSESKTLSSYYRLPRSFVFGNRSPSANGSVILLNPIVFTNYINSTVFVESTNHVVAVRLRGEIGLSKSQWDQWYFKGNKGHGGYAALEADNTAFSSRMIVQNNANLLINDLFAARTVEVNATAAVGGTGTITGTLDKVTIAANGTLFGGEYGKGGCLKIHGNLKMEANSILRVEVPDEKDAPVGYVKLANTDSGKELNLTAPIKVMVDASLKSPCRRVVKVMDWSDAVYKNGTIPTREMFTPVYGEGTNVRSSRLYVEGDALYISYVLDNVPLGSTIIIR